MNGTANQPLLEVRGLCKSFGDLEVLKSIDQNIYKGEKVAVIGPSGSGKSTFLRCLNCMEDPTDGSIFFGGEDLADMKVDINKHRENIGMVFQQFNLFNNKTVIENIMLAPVHLRIKKAGGLFAPSATKKQIRAEEKEKALALLRRIGLEEKANVYPSTLSGGQKQRIAIVRALAMLGDRAGICRYGSFLLPMDEALAQVALDLSNRPYLVYNVKCPAPVVGDIDVQLFHEFFHALAVKSGMNLHIDLIRAGETHHALEAVFKAFARALDAATQTDPRIKGVMSTKGVL